MPYPFRMMDNGRRKETRGRAAFNGITIGLASVLWVGFLMGCATTRISDPKRTATEQLLLSTAADRALAQADVTPLKKRKVWLDTSYLQTDQDKEYVIGSIRDLLISNGAFLMADLKEAEIVVEARSAADSIDSGTSLTGIPALPIPIPLTGVMKSPELALYKSQTQKSLAKFALVAYERESRQHVMSQRALVGTAFNTYYQVLGLIKFRRTDVAEQRFVEEIRKSRQPHPDNNYSETVVPVVPPTIPANHSIHHLEP